MSSKYDDGGNQSETVTNTKTAMKVQTVNMINECFLFVQPM